MGAQIGLIVVIALLAACNLSSFGDYIDAVGVIKDVDQTLLERGRQVYLEQYCGVCHQLSTAATRGTFAPSHDSMGATASQRIQEASYTGSAQTPVGYVRESLLAPRLYIVPGYEMTNHQMPSYEHLAPEAVGALVYFLVSQ